MVGKSAGKSRKTLKKYIVTMPAVFEQRLLVQATSKKDAIDQCADRGVGIMLGKPVFSHSLDRKEWSAMKAT